MQKNKFEILVLKTTILDPQKAKEKHEEKFCLKVYISKLENALFRGSTNFFSFIAFKTINALILFLSVFLKSHNKKLLTPQKWPKWRF